MINLVEHGRIAYAAPPASPRRVAPAYRPAAIACLLTLLALCALAAPAAAQTDPRNPDAIGLPEIGRMNGTLKCVTAMDESFGRQIYPIGDVDNDGLSDWILTHRRCDTAFGAYAVVELLLYHGVRGGLPSASAGMRIGPSQVAADCSFIGAGDYDADGHRDLAISQRILGDPFGGSRYVSSVVILWNDGRGQYSLDDTTHLTAPNQRLAIMAPDQEMWPRVPINCDMNLDGVDDLTLVTYGAEYTDGVRRPYPAVSLFAGHRNARWGRGGIATQAVWRYAPRLFQRRVSVLDHDGDGALDIVMYSDVDEIGGHGGVAVAYGNRGAWPDTVVEGVAFTRIGMHDGKRCEMIDLTGDRVPELVVSTGDTVNGQSWRWLVYVGQRGQRLLEQYGSGNDAPRPGDSLWWGRPWTIILAPVAINPAWNGPMHPVLDAGDVGLDGIGDFCAYTYPTVNCYNGGGRLDSYFDSWINTPIADGSNARLFILGDIVGDGTSIVGVPMGNGGVAFVRPSRSVPRTGVLIRVPEGSERPMSSPPPAQWPNARAELRPNPARSRTLLEWFDIAGSVSVTLSTHDGRALRRWLTPAGETSLDIDVTDMPAGLYFVTLRACEGSTTLPLTVIP